MRYEYKIEAFNEKGFATAEVKWQRLEERLNMLGADGWDIDHIQPLSLGGGQSGVVVFLKRSAV